MKKKKKETKPKKQTDFNKANKTNILKQIKNNKQSNK